MAIKKRILVYRKKKPNIYHYNTEPAKIGEVHTWGDGSQHKKTGEGWVEVTRGKGKVEEKKELPPHLKEIVEKQKGYTIEELSEEDIWGKPKEKQTEKIITDPSRIQKIKESIKEGELILKTGKIHGRKMSQDELDTVRKQVNREKKKIGIK